MGWRSTARIVSLGLPLACFATIGMAAAGDSQWQMTMAGEWRQVVSTGHVLTAGRTGGLLYAPSEDDNPDFRAAVSACSGATVDYFDPRVDTPSLELLSTYDCVFTWGNYSYLDYEQFGENLVDYVDAGGRVILGQWAYDGFSGNTPSLPTARILEPDYCPVTVVSSYATGAYAGDGTTCLHDDVTYYEAFYLDLCQLQGDGIQDGTFDNGWLAVAYRPDFRVVYSPGNTGGMYSTGDWALIVCNACLGCWLTGDMNCDDSVDFFDIDGFVLAITDPGTYEAAYPDCDLMLADANGDGLVNFFDIDAFVELLVGGGGLMVETELAGNSLGTYPFFEYVKAFNENATVEVAIDPSRHGDLVGETADIYVVAAQTADEWDVDPALSDETPVGPLTVTFGGATIQENTFTVAGPYELSSDAGHGLGVGYDVVIDVNQNGQLDGADYIDGYGDEAGFYVVHDTTQPGPLPVTSTGSYSVSGFGIPAGYNSQITYYPSNIAELGQLPLVTIAHGGGMGYNWYGYLQEHLASYGYIVMSHKTDNAPGPEYAATCVLGHTEAIIDGQSWIAGGALDGHIDANRIIWTGHSRGGEGVVRAYDRIHDGMYTPIHYALESIVLISAMAPTDFLGTYSSNPHDANFALWVTSGNADVSGDPGNPTAQPQHFYDRATGFRQAFVIQGAGHAWFHDGGGSAYFSGPCPIGEENMHLILKGYHVPLLKYYAEGNIPATDFLWRQHESFKPIGIPPGDFCEVTGDDSVVVTKTFHNGAPTGNLVIDDYEYGEAGVGYDDPGISSLGGFVGYSTENLFEGVLRDTDFTFDWDPGDPMNGMLYAGQYDDARGVVFDWDGEDLHYQQQILPEYKDLTGYVYLSFRACQGTRHPYTVAEMGDLTFSVTLRDDDGTTSSINVGAYGGGIEEPYQRSGAGDGVGWFNEMETIRIRLTDFLHNGSGLDLTDIVAMRFDVGPSWGADEGRLGLDDIELVGP